MRIGPAYRHFGGTRGELYWADSFNVVIEQYLSDL